MFHFLSKFVLRFDMKKGFVKVVGVVDVVKAKQTTIIRSAKSNVYIILKDASK